MKRFSFVILEGGKQFNKSRHQSNIFLCEKSDDYFRESKKKKKKRSTKGKLKEKRRMWKFNSGEFPFLSFCSRKSYFLIDKPILESFSLYDRNSIARNQLPRP